MKSDLLFLRCLKDRPVSLLELLLARPVQKQSERHLEGSLPAFRH